MRLAAAVPTRILTLALGVAVGLVLADSSIAVLALPAIYRGLDVELGDLHWVLTTFNLVLALAAVPAALLARKIGPVRTFAGGLAVFALASAGCALAPGFGALLAFRGVQALGGAAAVVAALGLLSALVRPSERAVVIWASAGIVGAAFGPALGGILTETISWRAVFAVQVPLALLPLLFLAGRTWPSRRERATAPPVAPNVALALVFAGLAAAFFLVVLLLIEGWHLSPIGAAAVMSALPLAAIACTPLTRRVASVTARATAGVLLVAGGLAGLALLPRSGWGWTLPPQILIGAGLALAVAALTQAALADGEPQAMHGGVTIAARHAGVVLGLLLLTPVLIDGLDRQRQAAEEAGTARLLDAQISPATKIRLAGELGARLDRSHGRIPELGPAFRSVDAAPDERPTLARLERAIDDIVNRAVTSSFSRAFFLAAALALAALIPIAAFRKRHDVIPRAFIAVAAAAGLAVIGAYAALGGGRYEPPKVADPCQRRPFTSERTAETLAQYLVLGAMDGVACRLHVSREEVVLALLSKDAATRLEKRHHLDGKDVESALRAGLLHAVDDAQRADVIGTTAASLLRIAVRTLPLQLALDLVRNR